jgi:hypothetical protein
MANILPMRRLLLLSRWVLVGWLSIRKLLSPQQSDAAPFLTYLGRLGSLNALAVMVQLRVKSRAPVTNRGNPASGYPLQAMAAAQQ